MALHKFQSNRITGGNTIFPDEIFIDDIDQIVIFRKNRLFGSDETKMRFDAIASVEIKKGLIFADIIVETRGGRSFLSNGFSHNDADEIKDLLTF